MVRKLSNLPTIIEAMLMTKKLAPMHRGEVLREEVLVPLGIARKLMMEMKA